MPMPTHPTAPSCCGTVFSFRFAPLRPRQRVGPGLPGSVDKHARCRYPRRSLAYPSLPSLEIRLAGMEVPIGFRFEKIPEEWVALAGLIGASVAEAMLLDQHRPGVHSSLLMTRPISPVAIGAALWILPRASRRASRKVLELRLVDDDSPSRLTL
jgi:hypothetical protein